MAKVSGAPNVRRGIAGLFASLIVVGLVAGQAHAAPEVKGVSYFKLPQPQDAGCSGLAFNITNGGKAYRRDECGFADFTTSGVPNNATVSVRLSRPGGSVFATLPATNRADDTWRFSITPTATWPGGEIRASFVVNNAVFGTSEFFHNYLEATIEVKERKGGGKYRTGENVPIEGEIYEVRSVPGPGGLKEETPVPAEFFVRAVQGPLKGIPWGPFQANDDGEYQAILPDEATDGIGGPPGTDVKLKVQIVKSSYDDEDTGAWGARVSASTDLTMKVFEPRCPGFKKIKGNHIIGTKHVDFITGTSRKDVICGLRRGDRLRGIEGDDVLIGGPGKDFLGGGRGKDKLRGGTEDDTLVGRSGNDRLRGGADNDFLRGGPGTDRCRSGPGKDEVQSCE